MAWPTLSDYNAALSRAPETLLPASLAGYHLVMGPMGAPMPVSGGYAYVYELRDGGKGRKALRCFREDDSKRRILAARACSDLATAVKVNPELRPHFLTTSWEDPCIKTASGTIPAMVMEWADARTLGAQLEAIQDNPSSLLAVRERIAEFLKVLAMKGIVHGDLQTGNILIRSDGTPVLIDYDGMRFPSTPQGPASLDSHPNFQHPEWDDKCDPNFKDRFPAIAIDLGLAALAANPELFQRYSTGENVLFRAEDYADPNSSPVFQAVRAIPELERAADLLAGLALGPATSLPSLEEFRSEAYKTRPRTKSIASTRAAVPVSTLSAAAYRSPYQVFSASDYSGLFIAVGEKVEVVGQVVSIKRSHTKYGKPYAFVNFGDWRRNGFKLTVWSEGLETFRKPPTESWVGKWVSATGLVDEPYTSDRFGTTQLSITIQDASQVRFLDEEEALRRLGRDMEKPADKRTQATSSIRGSNTSRSNTEIVLTSHPSLNSRPSNDEILKRLGSSASPASSNAARSSNTSGLSSLGVNSPASAPRQSPPPKDHSGWLVYLFIGIGIALYFFITGSM